LALEQHQPPGCRDVGQSSDGVAVALREAVSADDQQKRRRVTSQFGRAAAGGAAISGWLGNWTSPLAIVFQTAPVQSNGRSYQLRRVLSVLSESAFDLAEEFSVDGGAFRKLGTAHYTKQ
jgi:hypothetical protein